MPLGLKGPGKARRSALTREPGDLPVAVVFRPAGVRRAKWEVPSDDVVGPRVLRGLWACVSRFTWAAPPLSDEGTEHEDDHCCRESRPSGLWHHRDGPGGNRGHAGSGRGDYRHPTDSRSFGDTQRILNRPDRHRRAPAHVRQSGASECARTLGVLERAVRCDQRASARRGIRQDPGADRRHSRQRPVPAAGQFRLRQLWTR